MSNSSDTALPSISIQNLSYELPDGRSLFKDLSCSFYIRHTAIVGPNGIGKTVLAKILSGKISPHEGSVHSNNVIGFVPQSWGGSEQDTLASVLGLSDAIHAINEIEKGSTVQAYFDLAEKNWDWKENLAVVAKELQLPEYNNLNIAIGNYSGGEQLRWLWAAALLKSPDILIMDEPSNHLDREGREFLFKWLQTCVPLVIVISHDRELLAKVNHIVELAPQKCIHHSGNYGDYQQNRQQRIDNQHKKLQLTKKKLNQEKREAQLALEKQQQHAAKGKNKAIKRNISALEVGAAKNKASASQQRLSRLQSVRIEQSRKNVVVEESDREWIDPIAFTLQNPIDKTKKMCTAINYVNRFKPSLHPPLNFNLRGAERLQILGKNGSGKSVLLNNLVSKSDYEQSIYKKSVNKIGVEKLSSENKLDKTLVTHVTVSFLDQHNSQLKRNETGVENFKRLCPGLSEQEYRERLSWVRLRNTKADICVKDLSGGEQMKVALAVALLRPQVPQLLVLDEPTNHLDLDSLTALEQALLNYCGSIIVVSHDQQFIEKLNITHKLQLETGEFWEQ